jgi:hypothetical protein
MMMDQALGVLEHSSDPRLRKQAAEDITSSVHSEESVRYAVVRVVSIIAGECAEDGVVETAIIALGRLVQSGYTTSAVAVEAVMRVIDKAQHRNRFVREAVFAVIAIFCDKVEWRDVRDKVEAIARVIRNGLADNWSQVRFAASIGTRKLFEKFQEEIERLQPSVLDVLVPPMCFNRYYLAEGLRNYSLETWKNVFRDTGKAQVVKRIQHVCQFYETQLASENYTVRLSACHCVSELGTKIALPPLKAEIPSLSNALESLLSDQHWNVRSAACIALGDIASPFLDQFKNLSTLIPKLKTLACDPISAVREDSTTTLVLISCKLRNQNDIEFLFSEAEEHLKSINTQNLKPNSGSSCSHHDSNCAHHSKGAADHCDIGIYLVRELSAYFPNRAETYIAELQNIACIALSDESLNIKLALWNTLPVIASRVGKSVFEKYLDDFILDLFQGVMRGDENARMLDAAISCIKGLVSEIGAAKFKSHIKSQRYLDLCSNDTMLKGIFSR